MFTRFLQPVKELGPLRISAIVSDDTAVTKKGRKETASDFVTSLNLADPLHKLPLTVQDICRDEEFLEVCLISLRHSLSLCSPFVHT